jgi:two-component system chemotaxis sensor kinase CheA
MNVDDALQTFISESRELLADMEAALLTVEQAPDKHELVNAIFRAAHTIKGSAGLFSLDHVVAFTHGVESLLDRVRAGKLEINEERVALLLSCRDHLGALIDAVAANSKAPDLELTRQGEPLTAQLRAHLAADGPGAAPAAQAPPPVPATAAVAAASAQVAGPDGASTDAWHLSLRFGTDVLKNGMDPLNFIRYLQTLGQITGIATVDEALPPTGAMDPELCYLGYEVALRTDADAKTLDNVFEFVRDDSSVRILPPHSPLTAYLQVLQQPGEPTLRLGELLVRCGTLTPQELEAARAQPTPMPAGPPAGIGVVQRAVPPDAPDTPDTPDTGDAALARQKSVKEAGPQETRSVRVDADKLDQLINLVGELIIAGANVNLIARRAQFPELQESTSKLSMLVQEVRDSALQLRMVKIGATFNRYQRVVHDMSRELDKDIALQIDGEETELDKTVVEKIGDPLMHLVRNAMDHGIESAALRAERGKPAQGTVSLGACHDSGSIVITVEDDGGGLHRERILAKAVERGLVEHGHQLSDGEVYSLIFEPGFSTAEKITNLSGRGVGLDVVKRNISALRGTVEIASQAGVGTCVTIRLPLTLAIIDGFLIGVGKSVFAVPLDMIEECVAFSAEPGHDYTNLRGEVLPFIRLRELFSIKGAPTRGENIVVIKHAGQKAGLVVDTLLGEFQTVIKPLGQMFNQVRCISGSTILGSGEVALILDVPALVNQAISSGNAGNAAELAIAA